MVGAITPESSKLRALAYIKRAQAYFAVKKLDAAVGDLEASTKLNPEDMVAFNELGLAYGGTGDYAKAIAALDSAIALDPKNADAYYNRGALKRRLGQFDAAIADFQNAVKLGPQGNTAYIENGQIARGEIMHANANYYKELARTYLAMGDKQNAFTTHDEAVKQFPTYAYVFQNRAEAYIFEGDFEHGIADLNKAISLEPDKANTYSLRAFMQFQRGNYTASAADFKKAWSIKPDDNGFLPKDYLPIWIYLTEAHGDKQAATAGLKERLPSIDQSEWPLPIGKMFLGQQTFAQVMQAASTPDQNCEAQFYGAEWSILQGDKFAARTALNAVVKSCPKAFLEYTAATRELPRLNP